MTQSSLEILDEDEGFLFGKLDNLGVLIWRSNPSIARVQRIVAAFARFDDEHGFGLFTIIGPHVTPPGAEIRHMFNQTMRAYRNSLLGIATVVQTEGVLGSLSRAIARTLSTMSRTPYPQNVYASVEEAAHWISSIIARPPLPELPPSAILKAIAEHYPKR
jgi:hypothetical protein